jgi:hypothetical protein
MGSIFTTSYGIGRGGNIVMSKPGQRPWPTVRRFGRKVVPENGANGPAGKISLSVDHDLFLSHNSAISTSALQSSGGDILGQGG